MPLYDSKLVAKNRCGLFGVYLCFFIGCATTPPVARNRVETWKDFDAPRFGKVESIGTPSNGCLWGAQKLPERGPGFQVMRLSRNRHYGHPTLVQLIQDLGVRSVQEKWGTLLIGDLSQPRGGPNPTGHASHQTGLDFDLWYQVLEDFGGGAPPHWEELETISALSVVDSGQNKITSTRWGSTQEELLQYLSERPEVEKIFVDAAIKKELCNKMLKKNGATLNHSNWLRKLRPWWNHADHMHVRIFCPNHSKDCIHAEMLPPENGCDSSLDWWFSEEAKNPPKAAEGPRLLALPERCDELISQERN